MATLNIGEGMRFGMGVDSITESVCARAIDFEGTETASATGQKVPVATTVIIETQEQLMTELGISVRVSARYGTSKVNAQMDLAQRHEVQTYSIFILFKAEAENAPLSMVRPVLRPEAETMFKRDPKAFRITYGDCYIDRILMGGSFLGLMTWTTRSEREKQSLSVNVRASFNSFMVDGSVDAKFKRDFEQASRDSRLQIDVMRSGGSGLKNPTDLGTLRDLFVNFNAEVMKAPWPFKVEIQEWKFFPLPTLPSSAEQLTRASTLDFLGDQVIQGIKMRSQLAYILAHPDEFKNPDLKLLDAKLGEVNKVITSAARRASECVDNIDKCSTEGVPTFVAPELPERTAGAIAGKWEEIKKDDARAEPNFETALTGSVDDFYKGPRGGKYVLFTNGLISPEKEPLGGIFWHESVGAFAVYGEIFQAYMKKGDCGGPLGYPKSDEMDVEGRVPEVRVSHFEKGSLFWNSKNNRVSEIDPEIEEILRKSPPPLGGPLEPLNK